MSEQPHSGGEDWTPQEEPAAEPPRRRTGLRRLLPTWRIVLGGLLIVLIVLSGGFVAGYLLVDIPKPNDSANHQTNVYLYSDGTQIARDGEVNRVKVGLDDIPRSTRRAVLAAEDRNFYHEPAVNIKAMARAGWNMVTGGGKQSGSTITQQYVKNYYLTQEQTLTRKAKEFFIAIKLDNEVSKDEILEGYLNTSYFGRNSYGIQAAAHAYYGKQAEKLTTAEGAYLAALVNAPNAYDTRIHPDNKERAVERWNYVLDGMVEEGWLSKSKRAGLEFPEPEPFQPPNTLSGQRGYLVEAVKQDLQAQGILSKQQLDSGGYRITTTLDREKQQALKKAVDEQLMSELSDEREVDRYVRAGGTSVDVRTGEVVALYGGVDYVKQYVNNATRRDYQVGSTFKPFLYASARQHEATTQDGEPITASTVYDGTSGREVIADGQGTGYEPENEDHRSYGQITVSEAMDKSVNSVFAQMGVDVGPQRVKDTAIALGLPEDTPNMPADASIALGVATASTRDMAEAYSTLARHGLHRDTTLVQKVERGGELVDLPGRRPDRAVPRDAADSTTAMLESVVEGGTGTAAQAAGRPAAGKTGTAEEDRAAWFAGYTPELATVISVMGQKPDGSHEELYGAAGRPRVNGGGFPAEIWAAYTADALSGQPAREFDLLTTDDTPTLPPSTPGDPDPTTEPPAGGEPTTEPPTDTPPTSPEIPEPPTHTPTIPTEPGTPPGPDTGGTAEGGTTDGTTGGTDGGTTGGPGGGTGGTGGGTDGGSTEGGWGGTTGEFGGGTEE
ncbi:transglycosylase domain-containing protein [Streptomyces sp. JJ36]|uniref:transglycosylase domain-containing protein n=1 Tax=Streptomyces sp. JJ36 TaxID=2736645 RepID=UPI001F33005D|nr:transglycosylase domain-containing protein [Streptomyces sp. JJ36]MCF6525615.1 penicillin-binding protein [Streptomyces sp. JJ36]